MGVVRTKCVYDAGIMNNFYSQPSKVMIDSDYIEIKKSNIPGAGRGVFATRKMYPGKMLAYYTGIFFYWMS